MTTHRGVTLVELIVTLSILGVLSAVTVLAIGRVDPPRPGDPRTILADTLRAVVTSGRTALVHVLVDDSPATATVRPDGSIVADSALQADRLTGAPAHAR